MSYKNDSRYVFIDFENVQSAQSSAATPIHQINGKSVTVYLNEKYSSFFDIDWSLIPPVQESTRHMLNSLPDECLLDIFKFLEVEDLITAADTCSKFRNIAKDIFSKKFSNVTESTIDEMDARTLARFFRNFGSCMTSFQLNCQKMLFGTQARYLELFCRYFAVSESSLEELKIKNISRELSANFSQPLQFVISRLKILALQNCNGLQFSFGIRSTGKRK